MLRHHNLIRGILLFVSLAIRFARPASAQTLFVGAYGDFDGNLNPSGVTTAIENSGATADGTATTATFGWSTALCPAAVKIKFFRPVFVSGVIVRFDFLEERGSFDVPGSSTSGGPQIVTVTLDPPVSLLAGDVIALANLTSCGGPTLAISQRGPRPFPPPPVPQALIVPGDVTSTIPWGSLSFSGGIYAYANGPSPVIPLLSNRFQVALRATNPRTGAVADGVPNPLYDGGGYFSLPDFTGNSVVPEVTVKMVDATGSPALGGDFWFFHAPLTDVQYTITVRDRTTLATRTYSNTSASPGLLCGGVDTSAFPGR